MWPRCRPGDDEQEAPASGARSPSDRGYAFSQAIPSLIAIKAAVKLEPAAALGGEDHYSGDHQTHKRRCNDRSDPEPGRPEACEGHRSQSNDRTRENPDAANVVEEAGAVLPGVTDRHQVGEKQCSDGP